MTALAKIALGLAGAAALAITTGGALHVAFARRWLAGAVCPVGHAHPAELASAHHVAILSMRGDTPAPARPALGFDLDRTTRDDARAWAQKAGVTCRDAREGLVVCGDVPPAALGLPDVEGRVDELFLGFDLRGVLVDVVTRRSHVASADVARDIQARLESRLGAPRSTHGTFDDAHLAANGIQSLSSLRYRYDDYLAEVVAMRFPADGLVLREHYASARE